MRLAITLSAVIAFLAHVPALDALAQTESRSGSNGGKGTELDTLWELTVDYDRDFAAYVEKAIQSGLWRDYLYSFVEQVDPQPYGIYSPAIETFRKLRDAGLLRDIAETRFELSDHCSDGQTNLPAMTQPFFGAPICLDAKRIARLGEIESLRRLKNAPLFFGITMHEFARHYGQDEDHRFLVAMAQLLDSSSYNWVYDRGCSPTTNLCRARRGAALDLAVSPRVRVTMRLQAGGKVNRHCREGVTADIHYVRRTNVGPTAIASPPTPYLLVPSSDGLSADIDFSKYDGYQPYEIQVTRKGKREVDKWGEDCGLRSNYYLPRPEIVAVDGRSFRLQEDTPRQVDPKHFEIPFFFWGRPDGFGPLR